MTVRKNASVFKKRRRPVASKRAFSLSLPVANRGQESPVGQNGGSLARSSG